jgi:alpha-galactosidase
MLLDLKYDNCNVPEEWVDDYEYSPESPENPVPPPGYDYGDSKTAERYHFMRNALLAQNRTIQYSLCAWGHAHVERWGNETGHSWRMWGDIYPEWAGQYDYSWGLMPILNQAARHWNDSNFWGHNDWDMLEVGNGNLTIEESRSHFALWAAFKSPLIVGTRLEGISKPVLDILKTKELIDFNQDPVYGQGVRPFNYGDSIPPSTNQTLHPPSHYVGTSTKGIHLFLLNSHDKGRQMEVKFEDVPGLNARGKKEKYLVHDMWTGKDIGVFRGSFTIKVKKHDTAALRLTTLDSKSQYSRLFLWLHAPAPVALYLIELPDQHPHPNPEWTPTSPV